MEKIYGTTIRQDALLKTGRKQWTLFYGLYEDGDGSYEYRMHFGHKPSGDEIRRVICNQIDLDTEAKILSGFEWDGKPVWLSTENQMNFKAAYDLAFQMQGATLPVKFKLGETADGEAVYHTFETMDDFSDLYMKAVAYINQCLTDGWAEKDSLDMSKFGCDG